MTQSINVKEYWVKVTCEICGREVIAESDSLEGFLARMKQAYDNNWKCKAGHAQPSIIALKKYKISRASVLADILITDSFDNDINSAGLKR